MNLSRIKNLVKENGDKVILVENDEPEVVVMSFREYERISANHAGAVAPAHAPYHSNLVPKDPAPQVHEAGFSEPRFAPHPADDFEEMSDWARGGGEFIPHLTDSFASPSDALREDAGFIPPTPIAVSDMFLRPEEIRLEDLPL